jgi:hypothetical protein
MYFAIAQILPLLHLAFILAFPARTGAEIAQCNGVAPENQPFTLLREMCHITFSPASKLRCICVEGRIDCPAIRMKFYRDPVVREQAEICSSRCHCTEKRPKDQIASLEAQRSHHRGRRNFNQPQRLPPISEYPQSCYTTCTSYQACGPTGTRGSGCNQAFNVVDRVQGAPMGLSEAVRSSPKGK